jgi:hypothetical protein
LLAAAALPLGIPLVSQGVGWAALGAGLAAACLALAACKRPALVFRLALALVLAGLGYAPALTARLADAGESAPPVLSATPDAAKLGPGPGPGLPPPPPIYGLNKPALRFGRGRTGLLDGPPMPLPTAVEPLPGPDGAAGPRLVARVAEALAAAVDPEAGAALLLTRHGRLHHYSYPDFGLRGSYQLDRPAYRAALDGRRGLLYVASCPDRGLAVSTTGDREGVPGDVRVYDVGPLLRGALSPGAALRPVATFPDQGYVPGLALAPDRRWLYYLAVAPQVVTLCRLSTERLALDREETVRGGAGAVALAPDGKALYLATVSAVRSLDPVSLQRRAETRLPFVPFDLAADNDGRAFVSSRGERPTVLALDMRRDEAVLASVKAPFPGRLYLGLTPDGRRLYLGTSSIAADRLQALRVDGERVRRPLLEGAAVTDEAGLVRGEFQITPDGRFLLNRWGKVYRLPDTP